MFKICNRPGACHLAYKVSIEPHFICKLDTDVETFRVQHSGGRAGTRARRPRLIPVICNSFLVGLPQLQTIQYPCFCP